MKKLEEQRVRERIKAKNKSVQRPTLMGVA